jgi:hypothetical protein
MGSIRMALGRLVTGRLYGAVGNHRTPSIITPMISMTYQDMSKQIRAQVSNSKRIYARDWCACVTLCAPLNPDCVEGDRLIIIIINRRRIMRIITGINYNK